MGILTPQVYAFDVTGNAPENKVVNEQHTVTPVNTIDLYFIAPRYAPFYKESMVVKYLESGTNKPVELKASVDYLFSYRFLAASLSTTKEIYGGISIINTRLSGVIVLEYQTLGGDWLVDENTYLKIVNDKTHNPIVTYWDEIADIPYRFPVTNHDWNIQDLTGAEDLVAAINAIESSLRDSSQAGLTDHMSDYNNPHRVTKAQVGLGNVINLPLLPANHGSDNSNNYYLTPTRAIDIINYQIADDANAHMENHNNPHHVTKAQVGLGSVLNLPILPEGSGTDTSDNYYVTPRGVNDIIAGNSGASISAHISDHNNPHDVTKAQVGLSNVLNLPILPEGRGTNNTDSYFTTPRGVNDIINATVVPDLNSHINDHNNPHHVTKSDVGLSHVQNLPILPSGNGGDMSDNYYVTPRGVNDIVSASTGGSINDHISDHNNPHDVTKEQIGLSNVENYNYANDHFTVSDTSSTRVVTNDGLLDALNYIPLDAATIGGESPNEFLTPVNNNIQNNTQSISDLQNQLTDYLDQQPDDVEGSYKSNNSNLPTAADLANGVLQPIASFNYALGDDGKKQFGVYGILPYVSYRTLANDLRVNYDKNSAINLICLANRDGYSHPEYQVPLNLYFCIEINDYNQTVPKVWIINQTTTPFYNKNGDADSTIAGQSRFLSTDSIKSLLNYAKDDNLSFNTPEEVGFYISTTSNIDFDKTPLDNNENPPDTFVASGFDDITPVKKFTLYMYQKDVISDLIINTTSSNNDGVQSELNSDFVNISDIDDSYIKLLMADDERIEINSRLTSSNDIVNNDIKSYITTYDFQGNKSLGFINEDSDLYNIDSFKGNSVNEAISNFLSIESNILNKLIIYSISAQ